MILFLIAFNLNDFFILGIVITIKQNNIMNVTFLITFSFAQWS